MRIALLGDIATFGKYCLNNNKNLLEQLSDLKKHLSSFDVVIGNLEAPFALNEKPVGGKSATVKAHPCNIELLVYLGITHLNLANNHIGDFGLESFERTKDLLVSNGIEWFGAEGKQIEIHQNEKIALLGYCSHNTNPSKVKSRSARGLNYLHSKKVYDQMKYNAKRGFFNILSIHSGQEHVHMPSSEDVRFARFLANEFDYVYYGHHPHVIQGFETKRNSSIFYSLGNCIFDDVYTPKDKNAPLVKLTEANKTGLIGEIEILHNKLLYSSATRLYLGEERISIGNDAPEVDFNLYNTYLEDAGTPEYNKLRSQQIAMFFNERISLRNLKWYLKRMNYNSVSILLKARKNAKLYKNEFLINLDLLDRK